MSPAGGGQRWFASLSDYLSTRTSKHTPYMGQGAREPKYYATKKARGTDERRGPSDMAEKQTGKDRRFFQLNTSLHKYGKFTQKAYPVNLVPFYLERVWRKSLDEGLVIEVFHQPDLVRGARVDE